MYNILYIFYYLYNLRWFKKKAENARFFGSVNIIFSSYTSNSEIKMMKQTDSIFELHGTSFFLVNSFPFYQRKAHLTSYTGIKVISVFFFYADANNFYPVALANGLLMTFDIIILYSCLQRIFLSFSSSW